MAKTTKTPTRPKPIEHEPLRLTAHRHRLKEGHPQWTWRARLARGDGKRQAVTLKHPESGATWFDAKDKVGVRAAASALLAACLPEPSCPDEPHAWRIETVEDLLNAWVLRGERRVTAGKLRESTLAAYRQVAARILFGPRARKGGKERVRFLGLVELRLRDLTPGRLESWVDSRLSASQGGAPHTLRGDLKVLKAAHDWGRRDYAELRARAPLPPVRELALPGQIWTSNRHTPTAQEVLAVLACLEGDRRLAVELLWATGGRLDEVASIRAGHILQRGMVVMDGKTGPRRTAIPEALHAALSTRANELGPEDYLLTGCTWVDRKKWLGRVLSRGCAAADVPAFTANGIRRAVVRRLRREGVADEVRLAMMGHTEDVCRTHYDDVDDYEKRKAVGQARLGGLAAADDNILEGPWASERVQRTGTDDGSGI